MKNLLILAYDFPPYVAVGALRPYSWYQYLKKYDVYPIVVTRQYSNTYGDARDYVAPGTSNETIVEETDFGTIIRTPYKPNLANKLFLKYGNSKFVFLRKLITAWYEFMQFIFNIGTKSGLYYGAKEYLANHKVDAIIATGDPFILFKYASALSKKHNVPFIADYRDPWVESQNRSRYMAKWNAFFERKFTANVACITTVSDFLKKKIEENVHGKQFYIMPNGYNPEAINAVKDIKQKSDCLRFAFMGTIYKWHPIRSVLTVFEKFADTHKFEIDFYGITNREGVDLKNYSEKLSPHVNVYKRMPNSQLLEEIAKHNAVLLFNDYSILGTKIYDYLCVKRKILLCYSNDNEALQLKEKFYPDEECADLSTHLQEDCINETQSGVVLENAAHLEKVLVELFAEFEQNGCIACNSVNTEQFSREYQAKKLAEIVKNNIAVR